MTQKLLLALVLLLTCVGAQAQAGKAASAGNSSIMHVDQFLASLRQEARQPQIAIKVESLIQDLNPSLYVKSGDVKSYGDSAPIVLYTDASSLSAVHALKPGQSDQIQMAVIRLSSDELRKPIDLSVFAAFPKLQYVYIQSAAKTTPAVITSMVENQNPNQQVFYSIYEIQ